MSNINTPHSGFGGNDAASAQSLPHSAAMPSTNESASVPTPASGHMRGRRMTPGTELAEGRYRIERAVAQGGMGAVYRAVDKRFNYPCAVKEMLDEFNNVTERSQAVEWFTREANLLRRLNHSCIPRVFDVFTDGGKHYLVMDFIEGRTLGEVFIKEGDVLGANGARGVSEARVRKWAQQICSVLAYLHSQTPPIIFRDLKPSNIMVTGNDEIKLIDFGIARPFQSQHQATIIMTVGYAPPEQLHGMPEPRSDIYSLAATLHRVLTNHDAANNKPTLFSFPPLRSLRPDLSPAFEQVVMKALAYTPDQRWANCMEMERALLNLPPITVLPPTVIASPMPPTVIATTVNRPLSGPAGGISAPPVATPSTTGPASSHIIAALNHIAAGRIEPAHVEVMQAHGLEPNSAIVHKLFGQVFARRVPPQVDLAMRAYNRSLELNPNDAETHKLVGDIWLFLRPQPAQGIPAYLQSVKLNPRDPETHFRLGQCYEKTGQLDFALRAYQEAFQLVSKQTPQPAITFALALGLLAKRLNQLPLAEQAFVQALTLNPADHQARFQLCQVYEAAKRFEDAFRECSYVIGPLGNNPEVQQVYARLRARLGR
ncbi:MAG: tetratricopeptide repeat protein [Chloroflexi bacterium]|nr:MAG: tetratricopeptide repeat protein [Chloroflexota bacterium]